MDSSINWCVFHWNGTRVVLIMMLWRLIESLSHAIMNISVRSLYFGIFVGFIIFIAFQYWSAPFITEVFFRSWDVPALFWYRFLFLIFIAICVLIQLCSAFLIFICGKELYRRKLKVLG